MVFLGHAVIECHSWGFFDRLEWFVGGREGEGRSERVVLLSIVHQFIIIYFRNLVASIG